MVLITRNPATASHWECWNKFVLSNTEKFLIPTALVLVFGSTSLGIGRV